MADFLTHLVGFALKLRNLNTTDHGLIRELSSPVAGSLVGGQGHSKVYEEDRVYRYAISPLQLASMRSSLSAVKRLSKHGEVAAGLWVR